MSQEIEREMRERLRAASGEEIVPGFDVEATWMALEPRVRKKRPSVLPGPWITHAAAVAAGLAIGWFALHQMPSAEKRGPVAAQMPVARIHDTVRIVTTAPDEPAPERATGSAPVAVRPVAAIAVANAAAVPLPAMAKEQDADTFRAPVLARQEPVVQDIPNNNAPARQPSMQVVHLLDIDNESRQLYKVPAPVTRKTNPVSFFLNRSRVPDDNHALPHPPSPLSFLD